MIFPSKEKLNKKLLEYFDTGSVNEFMMVNSIALAATHLTVICRKNLAPYISEVKNDTLALGIGDMMTNKGAVNISFKLGDQRLLFINCHLEAHDENLLKRNDQWNELNRTFVEKIEEEGLLGKVVCGPKKNKISHKTADLKNDEMVHYDSVIWLGDMNYRIQAT